MPMRRCLLAVIITIRLIILTGKKPGIILPRATPYNLDSLTEPVTSRGWRINLSTGIKFTLAKNITDISRHTSGLELKASISYHYVKYKDPGYSNADSTFFRDTTKTYTADFVNFLQQKNYINVQQAFVYKFNSFITSKLKHYIGIGFGVTFLFTHKITESGNQKVYNWNTQTHTFLPATTLRPDIIINGKKLTQLHLLMPFGATFSVSPKHQAGFDGSYTLCNNRFSGSPYSHNAEGYWFGLFYRYCFNK